MYIILNLFSICFIVQSCANPSHQKSEENISVKTDSTSLEVLAENLEVPWGMDFLPDGRLIFNERPGHISLLNLQTKEVKRILTRDIRDKAEGGLLGLAVDPDFNNTKHVFIYETISTGNRIVRLKLENDVLVEDKILIDEIPHALFHDGGILRFGPDGFLYAGTGDARDPGLAQDLKSYAGKILKMDKEGNAAADNPFGNLIYSYGHRNVQGLCWDGEGNMYASEHGPSGELNGWCCHDELNKIKKGANYGWPYVIGDDYKESMIVPLAHSGNETWAPGGIIYTNGKIFMACLRGERLIEFDIAKNFKQDDLFSGSLGRLRNILLTKDGSIIFCSSDRDGRGNADKTDDKIYRVKLK